MIFRASKVTRDILSSNTEQSRAQSMKIKNGIKRLKSKSIERFRGIWISRSAIQKPIWSCLVSFLLKEETNSKLYRLSLKSNRSRFESTRPKLELMRNMRIDAGF